MSNYKLESTGQKRLLSLVLLGATSSLFALGAEHSYLYKDPRIMGMGGANVAVGAYSTSVFSNPAGLTNIKKEHGIVVDLVGIGISVSDAQDIAEDIDDAGDDTDKMVDVLEKYNGQAFHIGFDNYTSISKNSDAFAWTIGLLAAVDSNFMTHSSDITLEVSSRGYGGVILGVAKSYDTQYGQLDVGFGVKYIMQQSYEGKLDIDDLVSDEDEIADILQEKYEKESSGYGIDIGVVYHPMPNSFWNPAIGMSILNLGSMDMDNNYGQQPTTINFGASVTPDVPFMNKLVIAVDYVDALDANEVRFYNMDESIEDLSESDMMKRIRFGVGMGLFDTTFISSTLNVGMYQSAYTAGVELEFLLFKLSAATYEEEVGTGSATNPDRRYMAKIGIGW